MIPNLFRRVLCAAHEQISSVTCGDLVPEALAVLNEFRHSDEVPLCYKEAASIIGVQARSLRARELPWRYVVFDAHHPWPERLFAAVRCYYGLRVLWNGANTG
jgi:hypothetical protein